MTAREFCEKHQQFMVTHPDAEAVSFADWLEYQEEKARAESPVVVTDEALGLLLGLGDRS